LVSFELKGVGPCTLISLPEPNALGD